MHTPAQNVEQKMCPFCPLFVEPERCDPVGYDFFGQPAKVGDVPSCGACAQIAATTDDGVHTMLEMLKKYQPEALKEWGQLGEALALSFEETMQGSGPINEEYCWEHEGPEMGGWSCVHPDCRTLEDIATDADSIKAQSEQKEGQV